MKPTETAGTSRQFVIIGGPSSGKTTLVDCLKTRGFRTVEDAARRLLLDKSVVKPINDRESFQRELLAAQLLAEKATVDLDTTSFLDGGVFDGCAYYICDGMQVPFAYDEIQGSRYRKAFLVDPLDLYVDDGIRYQDIEFTNAITPVLEQCYLERGVQVVRIPNVPVEQRLELILSSLD